jgi:two-component system, cell cycle sensor histidine kinase and response regulator CckA
MENALKFKSLFDTSFDAILLVNTDTGLFIDANQAACIMYGYSHNDFLKMRPVDLSGELDKPLASMQPGISTPVRFHRKKDGSVFPVEITGGYFTMSAVKIHTAFIRDITERLRAEEEKQKMKEIILQNQKLESLGMLAGGIAHDFNNVLSGIFGYIDLAISEFPDNTIIEYLSKALATIERARRLSNQILTFSKGGKPVKTKEKLFPFIAETAKMLLNGLDVKLSIKVQEKLCLCDIDKNQIEQVITNIINNSIQSMPKGGEIIIKAENDFVSDDQIADLKQGNYVKISITDTGTGITQENLPNIFDPFFTTKKDSTGIGLTICYSIIKRHGGKVCAESEIGKQTSLIFWLPASY